MRILLCVEFTSWRLGLAEVSFMSLVVAFIIGLLRLELDRLPGSTSVALARTAPEPGVVTEPTANLPASQLELTTMLPIE